MRLSERLWRWFGGAPETVIDLPQGTGVHVADNVLLAVGDGGKVFRGAECPSGSNHWMMLAHPTDRSLVRWVHRCGPEDQS